MDLVDLWWASWWGKTVAMIFMAAFGGMMGYMMRSVNGDADITIGRTLLETASAGFVGLVFKLVCDELHLSDGWTGVIVGLAGWLGASASVQMLEKLVYNKLGIEHRVEGRDHE